MITPVHSVSHTHAAKPVHAPKAPPAPQAKTEAPKDTVHLSEAAKAALRHEDSR